MAGGGVVTAGEIKHYEGRTTFFVCMVCVLAASGGLMFGYDVGISGNKSPHIRLWFFVWSQNLHPREKEKKSQDFQQKDGCTRFWLQNLEI